MADVSTRSVRAQAAPDGSGEAGLWCHGTCLAIEGAGILIRGESGAGKSVLALQLIERAAIEGRPAGLVGDDRIHVSRKGAGLLATGHPAIAGLIEVRGVGLCRIASVETVRLRLVVDLVASAPRMPETGEERAELCGLLLPRLVLERGLRDAGLGPMLVRGALAVASQPHSPGLGARLDLRP